MQGLRVLTLCGALFIAGCATTSPNINPAASNEKTVQGLFGLVSGSTAESGHFTWMQQGNNFTLELYGPLGLGATTLTDTSNDTELKTANGKIYWSDSPEGLLDDALGWSMPVSGFRYWLFGQAEPSVPYTATYDTAGHILTLNQEGWAITYTWQQNALTRILMIRGDVKLTIVMKGT